MNEYGKKICSKEIRQTMESVGKLVAVAGFINYSM